MCHLPGGDYHKSSEFTLFCFVCVGKYLVASSEAHSFLCPYCRGEVPNVAEKAFDRGKLYLDQAWALPKRSEEQKENAKLALLSTIVLVRLAMFMILKHK